MSLSEIRVNTTKTRTGVGTITYTETGPVITGIATASNFKTGTTNVHSTGVELANINTGGSTATFGGPISGTTASFSGNVSIGGTLTYEDVTNVDAVGLITARNGIDVTGGTLKLPTVLQTNTDADCKVLYQHNDNIIHGGSTLNWNPAYDTLKVNSNLISANSMYGAGGTLKVAASNHSSTSYVLITDKVEIGGLVGIGTDNPDNLLHLAGINTTVWPFTADVSDTYAYTPYPHELQIQNHARDVTGSFAGIYFHSGAAAAGNKMAAARIAAVDSGDYKSDLVFGTRNTNFRERLRITSDGKFGFNTQTPYAYDTTATTLEVKGSVSSAADTEVVRFRGGSDANSGTAVLRLTNDNDRGLVVKGGRESDAEFAEFGTSSYDGTYTRGIRINSSGKVGIKTDNIDRDLEVFNSGSQTAIGIKGGTNTSQCSLWFTKPTDSNIGGIYYLHGSDDNQGFHFRANDNQVANIKGSGIVTVENTISGAGHTSGVYIFKKSGSNDDHAELAVGYDRENCYVIQRKRNSGAIEINTTQSGAKVQHEHQGATRWIEHSQGMINTYAAGGSNFIGRWRYCQTNQSQNYEHHILGPDGTLLFPTYVDTNAHGVIWVGVTGTGTNNAYTQYRFSNKSNHANLQLVHLAGGSSGNSNVPYIVSNSNNPAWKMDHSGTYTMVIDVMMFGGKSNNGTFSTDAIRGANP